MGPGQLYQDLQNLLHDLNVVGQISQLVGSLRGNYQVTGGPRGVEFRVHVRVAITARPGLRVPRRGRIRLILRTSVMAGGGGQASLGHLTHKRTPASVPFWRRPSPGVGGSC